VNFCRWPSSSTRLSLTRGRLDLDGPGAQGHLAGLGSAVTDDQSPMTRRQEPLTRLLPRPCGCASRFRAGAVN
jgi:hypothetical protein